MIRIGTPNFVSPQHAIDYYRDYEPEHDTPAALERVVKGKVRDGEIFIGPPAFGPAERLVRIDNGHRYAIEGDEGAK